MAEPFSAPSSQTVLLSIVQQVVYLDWCHLTQLYEHLGEMIEQMEPVALPEEAPAEIVELSEDGDAVCSSRGNGYIEWKTIRHGKKVYGPYPYWRFIRDGKRYSIYLKELAQERRQSTSTTPVQERCEAD
jgi:hypothetical protein